MKPQSHKTRRSFIVSTASMATTLLVVGTAGCKGASENDRQLQFGSFADAEIELARLVQASGLASDAAWTWAQTLVHCAQSIEYSISGFPQSKPAIFQRTIGSAAIGVFSWRGRMTHDLAEPIPGAPLIEAQTDPSQALARLRAAILSFQQWSGPLQPHFAYGALDKAAYERAHAMHLANHFSAFHAQSAAPLGLQR